MGLSTEGWVAVGGVTATAIGAFLAFLVGFFRSEGAMAQRLIQLELRMGAAEDRQTKADERADHTNEMLARIDGVLSTGVPSSAQMTEIEGKLDKLLSDERATHGQQPKPESD